MIGSRDKMLGLGDTCYHAYPEEKKFFLAFWLERLRRKHFRQKKIGIRRCLGELGGSEGPFRI
jgi:hypothetical protein